MKTESTAFRIKPAGPVDLGELATAVKPLYTSKKDYKKQLKKHVKKLSSLQRLHYAPTTGRCC